MPRQNILVILLSAIVSLVCYRAQDRNPYGRYFAEVMDHIENRYVEKVDSERLFETAVQSMLGKLDENSTFITRKESAAFRETLDQEFGGIGIEIKPRDERSGQPVVTAVMVDTPAYRAGVQAGDIIAQVDGQDLKALDYDDAVKRIKGKVGEPVSLTLLRGGQTVTLAGIERATISVQSVIGDARRSDGAWIYHLADDRRIAYVRILSFGKHTNEHLDKVMQNLATEGIDALVLDLRNNPGGFLESAIHTCDLFLERGVIVSTRGRDDEIQHKFEATGGAPYTDFPMVVLVNRYSASASEIVAACLQDHGRATVVGERSYGKGTVQNVIEVEGGKSNLKLTTAYYWRPNNKNIHRKKDATEKDEWGVTPNEGYSYRLNDTEFERVFSARKQRDMVPLATSGSGKGAEGESTNGASPATDDPQLKQAIECLQKQLSKTGSKARAA